MAQTGYPIRVDLAGMIELDCEKAIKPVAEGGCSFAFFGSESMQLDAGLLRETIAAIATECYNKAGGSRVSGADAVMNLGCGLSYPEFEAAFFDGQHESSGLGGDIQVSFDKPGEDSCKPCLKADAEDCDPAWAIWALYCVEDCNGKYGEPEFMLIRCVTQATESNRKRVGGNNVDSFRSDISLTIDTNDNFGYGPGDFFVSDHEGEPECASVTCGIACPADLDLSALYELCGPCAQISGCKITPELLLEFPELNNPLFTG